MFGRISLHQPTKMLDYCIKKQFSTKLNFTPLFDRVIIERFAPEVKTKGGIMIPEKAQGKVLEGTVVAVGEGYRTESGKTIPPSIKIGDRVMLPEYGGSKLVIADKEYHVFRESDVIGKFN